MRNGGLGQAIDRFGFQGDKPCLGTYIDDLSGPLLDHFPAHGLSRKEGAFQIYIDGWYHLNKRGLVSSTS
jgi:hypothetical protein